MRRLYLPGLAAGEMTVDGPRFHYLARVLRLAPGAEVTLFDGSGREAHATVTAVTGEHLVLAVEPPQAVAIPSSTVTLVVALLKGEKMDWVIQKTTELGVDVIAPVVAARAVVKLEAHRRDSRNQRWHRIAAEAARQCGRADVPSIVLPAAVEHAFESVAGDWRGFLDPDGEPLDLGALPPAGAWAVAVGPEGGWSDEERAAALRSGWKPISLGPRVLRAETAAIAVVAGLRLFAGS